MLDYLAIFTKGGALLWAWQLSALQVNTRIDVHAVWRYMRVICSRWRLSAGRHGCACACLLHMHGLTGGVLHQHVALCARCSFRTNCSTTAGSQCSGPQLIRLQAHSTWPQSAIMAP